MSEAKRLTLVVAVEFSVTPGPRSKKEGPDSGEAFLEYKLLPRFDEAVKGGARLLVDLDGTEGYATSFLEAAFGGLARSRGRELVNKHLQLKSEEEPYLLDEIASYIDPPKDGK